jgi:hypothetical protein
VRAIAAGCSQTHNRQAQYAQSQLLAYTLVVNTGIANLFDFFLACHFYLATLSIVMQVLYWGFRMLKPAIF